MNGRAPSVLIVLFLMLAGPFTGPAPALAGAADVAGAYRCWSRNVGGAGGPCRTAPALVLRPDGTYSESSAHGTYLVRGDQLVLSASTVRGAGRLEGNRIVFEYVHNGLHHTVTYLKQAGVDAAPTAAPPSSGRPAGVPVEIALRFPPSDGSVGWINSVALVSQGGTTGPEALGRTDGKHTVLASFRAVEPGHVYTVWVSSGFERRPVGTLDLRATTGAVSSTLDVSATTGAHDRAVPPSSASGPAHLSPAASPSTGVACNPNVPRYAQKGCVE